MTKKEKKRIEGCISKKFKDGVDYTLLNKGERRVLISLYMEEIRKTDFMLSLPLNDDESRYYGQESKNSYDSIDEINKLNK